MKGGIDRGGKARRHGRAYRADRAGFGGKAEAFNEEYKGRVFVHQRRAAIRLRAQPVADGVGAGLLHRHLAALHQNAANGAVGVVVLARKTDAKDRPVGQADAARALDLKKESLDRIVQPDQFKPPPGERAAFDFGAGQIGLIGQVVRQGVERRLIRAALRAGAVQFGFVIAGEQRRVAIAGQNRLKRILEHRARRTGRVKGPVFGPHAKIRRGARDGLRRQENGAGGVVVRVRPAGEIGEFQPLHPQFRRARAASHQRGEAKARAQTGAPGRPRLMDHSPVAISSQFGSGAPILRPKVQTSVSRRTSFGSPSTMRCSLSRTTVIISPTKRMSISAT